MTSVVERARAAVRAFKTGPAMESGLTVWGISPATFSPPEYGDYLATSNSVYACATLRAQMLASLPLQLYRVPATGDRKEVTAGNLWSLLQKVNPHWTRRRLIEQTELSLCLWGCDFWFLERGKNGRQPPQEIWWARPDLVTVVPDEQEYVAEFRYRGPSGQELRFLPSETIWLRYPNPIDEFAGLSPLAAARLAADVSSAAMQSNRNLFTNGLQMGGAVFPKAGTTLTIEQAKEIEAALSTRFKGVDKAHRWGVFRFEAEMQALGVTPKDAEFLGALNFSLEEVARAYKVPLDLLGGQRTYANVEASQKAIWSQCILPEASFIASELTEQLLPMFGEADLVEFDDSEIGVLHEDESAKWLRAKEQITAGAITVNEWREEQGLPALSWGDVWWASSVLTPVSDAEPPEPEPVVQVLPAEPQKALPNPGEQDVEEVPPARTRALTRAVDYGSDEHQRLWRKFVRRTDRYERQVTAVVQELFKRQEESVLAKLTQRAAIAPPGVVLEPFDMQDWLKRFRVRILPVLQEIVDDSGAEALSDIGLSLAFDVQNPLVQKFLQARAQRFAEHVNETTWQALKDSLSEGITAGESIPLLSERVSAVMGDRIRSTPEAIARTETIGASAGGSLEAYKQSGVVRGKTWLAALDDRTRDAHREAHGQTVGIDEDFIVGGERMMHPGADGASAGNVVNCRCMMTAVLVED